MTCTSTYSIFRNYQWFMDDEAEFDPTFLLQFLITILLRSVVVGSKYGLFSNERLSFFNELDLSQEMLSFDLTATRVNDVNVRNHLTCIEDIMEELKIDSEFFVFTIYKDQDQFGLRHTQPIIDRLVSEEKMVAWYEKDALDSDKERKAKLPYVKPVTWQWTEGMTWRQETLFMMETAFDNRYKFFDKASVVMVDSILNTDKCIKVPGKTLALEITKQNQALTNDKGHWLMMAAMFVFVQPFLRGWLLEEEFFLNGYHKEIYFVNMMPCFLLYMLNLVLYNCMSLILNNKMMYA